MAVASLPPIDDIRQFISYDSETGLLTWIRKPSKRAPVGIGKEAFPNIGSQGYKMGGIFGWVGGAHRVCWALHHGSWSCKSIDHINGIRHDNRICNLREVTASQNAMNRSYKLSSRSGHKGVIMHKCDMGMRWKAAIFRDSKQIHLGTFGCATAAAIAYNVAAQHQFGEFAFLNFSQRTAATA